MLKATDYLGKRVSIRRITNRPKAGTLKVK